jgi:hypothetical protein
MNPASAPAREADIRYIPDMPSGSRLPARLCVAAILLALLPIGVATIRAIAHDWVPVGDNAVLEARARDVLSGHPPVLGTWSSVSTAIGTDVNHPGPLLDDLLALPVRLGGSAGLALGVALINAGAIVGIAIVGYRRGGPLVATAATAAAAALSWSMGSELLYEPWNPHVVLLPFLLVLMLVWSITRGDVVAIPWAVAIASLVVQTHLSYVNLLGIVGVWAVIGLALELRSRRRLDPEHWPELKQRVTRISVIGALVLVVCWAQPLVEQFFGSGRGNLLRLAAGARASYDMVGTATQTKIIASVVAVPPWWFRPSFHEPQGGSSLATAIGLLVVVGAILAVCAWDARRRHDRESVAALATAAVALGAVILTSGRAPATLFGIAAHQSRWMWPLSAFLWFAVVVTILRRFESRPVPASVLVGGLALVIAVVVALNLPASNQGASSIASAIPVARTLGDQLDDLDVDGTVVVTGSASFADPYGSAVLAALARNHIDFVVGPGLVPPRQFNEARAFDPDEEHPVLYVESGEDALIGPAGTRRVAANDALDGGQAGFLRLRRQIAELIDEGGLQLNARGEELFAHGRPRELRERYEQSGVDADDLLGTRALAFLVRNDLLDVDEVWARRLERYVDLQQLVDEETVGVHLGPPTRLQPE